MNLFILFAIVYLTAEGFYLIGGGGWMVDGEAKVSFELNNGKIKEFAKIVILLMILDKVIEVVWNI